MMNKILAILAILGLFLAGCAHLPDAKGRCPEEFPIKGNANSYIYHAPDGKYYWRTGAEWCFKNEKDAKALGYRKSKE
tara:strand:+ start:39 stop:272 length:234 start_codon:yes stop_codon:yes gene_type:complete